MSHGSIAAGVIPDELDRTVGAAGIFNEDFRKKAHREVLNALHGVMTVLGQGDTPEAHLVKGASVRDRNSSQVVRDCSDIVFDTLGKQANIFTTLAKGLAFVPGVAQTGLAAAGAVPVLGGAAVGALYNMSKRDIRDDTATNEAYRNKIKYYNALSDEVRARLKEKYGDEDADDRR